MDDNRLFLAALGHSEIGSSMKPASKETKNKRKAGGCGKSHKSYKLTLNKDEAIKSPNTLATEAAERAERRRDLRPQVRALFVYEDDSDYELEPHEGCAAPCDLPQVDELHYDECVELMQADWHAWQLLFLTHNHVFEFMCA